MIIAIASDHASFRYKERIAALLRKGGHEVRDFGTDSSDQVDYPPFVGAAAGAVATGKCDWGIVSGGSGNGETMVANRYRGVRCAFCWNVESARLARSHNDTNVLAPDKRLLTADLALQIVDIWLETEFEGGLKHRAIVDTPRSHYGSENDVSVLALMAAPTTFVTLTGTPMAIE